MARGGRTFVLATLVAAALFALGVVAGRASERRARRAPSEEGSARAEPASAPAASASPAEREPAETERLAAQVARLRAELAAAEERRLARELEWVEYTGWLASLDSDALRPEIVGAFETDPELAARHLGAAPEPEPEPPPPDPAAEARRRRGEQIRLSLRNLMRASGLDGLELLEAGVPGDGWTGPVVLRVLDQHGRPIGALAAERLRLEASTSARTLAVVLEEGYERLGTERVAFDGSACPEGQRGAGARRIELVQVDPLAWYEALPELFGEPLSDAVPDDGLWDALLVRRRLNELLERELDSGRFRLAGLAGVVDDVLRDVHVEELDDAGRVQRRLFADRLSVRETESGLLLFLEDGVQVRGGRKLPFLEGRFRIFLPRAPRPEWERAGVPGLCPVTDSPLALRGRG